MNDKYIKPSEHLAARLLVDEMIVMSLQDARVFSLNPTASALWGAADGVTRCARSSPARWSNSSRSTPTWRIGTRSK